MHDRGPANVGIVSFAFGMGGSAMSGIRPFIVAMAAWLICAMPTGAQAQTCDTAYSLQNITTPGAPSVRGKTGPTGSCSNRTWIIGTWIQGLSITCTAETLSGGYCIADNPAGEATSTALGNQGGQWTGKGDHMWKQTSPSGTPQYVAGTNNTLNAGSCVPGVPRILWTPCRRGLWAASNCSGLTPDSSDFDRGAVRAAKPRICTRYWRNEPAATKSSTARASNSRCPSD
jgi:hypothetical protein